MDKCVQICLVKENAFVHFRKEGQIWSIVILYKNLLLLSRRDGNVNLDVVGQEMPVGDRAKAIVAPRSTVAV